MMVTEARACARCGTVTGGANFCPSCGTRLSAPGVLSMPAADALLGAALLELLGWVGFLGLGYLVRGRVAPGLFLLIGWWVAFWVLLALTIFTLGALHVVMVAVWLSVPPLTAVFLYLDA